MDKIYNIIIFISYVNEERNRADVTKFLFNEDDTSGERGTTPYWVVN